jgi:hypothetical protein
MPQAIAVACEYVGGRDPGRILYAARLWQFLPSGRACAFGSAIPLVTTQYCWPHCGQNILLFIMRVMSFSGSFADCGACFFNACEHD